MNLDISLRNVPRKLRMKGQEDIVEWIQIINRRASTQIMMILVFLLMTMSWPENQGILFFLYISQTLQMNWISFMASLLNAVL